MKIALTTTGQDLNAPMDARFGRAARFLIYDTEEKTAALLENSHGEAAQGAGIKAAETIVRAGASLLITGDCGPKAFNALKQAGVKIFSAKDVSGQKALDLFSNGQLREILSA